MVDIFVCPHDDMPCDRFDNRCFIKGGHRTFYVCVRVRFKGANSVKDRGMGMTVYEKLKRQGLIPEKKKRVEVV